MAWYATKKQFNNKDYCGMNCIYYQAHVRKHDCWFFVAGLRSFEHMAFDRTLVVEENIFEFFVAPSMEPLFIEVMSYFEQQGMVSNLKRLPNRLLEQELLA